jgi:cytochrome c biogenesis protein CcmG/thiol:disulfide interchange protein DsbE
MKKKLGLLALIVTLVIAAAYFNNANDTNKSSKAAANVNEEAPQIHFKAPSFTLSSLDGQSYSVDDARGKPLIINFWASWCGPCKLEAPELVQIYEQYGDELEIYAVNLTASDRITAVKKFVEQQGFTFPILLDESGDVSDLYEVIAIPSTFFVNENGIIVDKIIGYGGEGSLAVKADNLVNR